ncbi:MAG: hypothetical protein FVQ79_07705 [Planctomycetes bacterium]|nr:hypothetical protein [Planctomycetota bacterium]
MDKRTIGGRITDMINPIAVKEMRQAVKSRLIIWVLMLFLLIQLVVIIVVLVFSKEFDDFNAGPGVFMTILSILLGTCLLFIPAITALRLASERSDSNLDLLFITTLRPRHIMWGKLVAAVILTLLFFSACLPFMTLTYLFRGLDLPSMFILLGLDFLVVVLSIQGSIMLAACPGGLIARGIRFLFGLALLVAAFGYTIAISGAMLFGGIGSSLTTWNFWGPALTIVACIFLLIGLLNVLSVALVSPPSSNKMIGVRIYTLFLWIASMVIIAVWMSVIPRGRFLEEIIYSWSACAGIGACILLFISICERQEWGLRIRRTIPQNIFLRLPAFLLYTGAAGGVLLSVLIMAASFLIGFFVVIALGKDPDDEFVRMLPYSAFYFISYALTALLIKRIFFKRVTFFGLPIAIALVLLIAGTAFPVIAAFLLKKGAWYDTSELWLICNPFVMLAEYRTFWHEAMLFSGIWCAVISLIMLPWFVKQFRSFKPLKITKTEIEDTTDERELSKVSA